MTKPNPPSEEALSAADMIRRLAEMIGKLPPDASKAFKEKIIKATGHRSWLPTPGPQYWAVECEADELFFGGSAGGSKTQTLIGLSLTKHMRSLILRRTNKEASKLIDEIAAILGNRDGYNGQENVWRLADGRVIDIGGCQYEDDKQKWKGIAHDGIFFDEIGDFTESIYRFITTWARSTVPGQRVRVVAAGNPPTTPEGLWVIKYWAPWLDPNHPNPAAPGELRWFTTIKGADAEVDGPGPHLIDGELITARSRTFIPARLDSNVFFDNSGYDATLAALPEELRRAYRDGRFDAVLRDDEGQVLPSSWITAAQERWRNEANKPQRGVAMSCMAVDVAQGGADQTVLVWRYDTWFARPLVVPGAETPTGKEVASLIVTHRDNPFCPIILDVGGGYAGSAITVLESNNIKPTRFNGSNVSHKSSNDGARLKFANLRAEAWWRFREALQPGQPGGSPICLPDDPIVRADLAAPRWTLTPRGVLIESKDEIKKRIGRSPDVGDALVMAWSTGQGAIRQSVISAAKQTSPGHETRPVFYKTGYQDMKAGRREGMHGQQRTGIRSPRGRNEGVWAVGNKWK